MERSSRRRELHLNAFLMEAGHHEAAWRLPESNPRADFDLRHWIGLAQLAEDAKFDSLFLADGPALTGIGAFRPPGQLEPFTLLTALSQHTSRIGLIATVSSTYNEPYNLARRLASVDHVSGGRAGWNIVTSAGADEAANFGLDDAPDHAARYERADEFLTVAKALWDSWESEAVPPTRHRAATPTGGADTGRGGRRAQRHDRTHPAVFPNLGRCGAFRRSHRGRPRVAPLHFYGRSVQTSCASTRCRLSQSSLLVDVTVERGCGHS